MPCGFGEEDILHHEMIEQGQCLPGMGLVGIGHGRVFAHDVQPPDLAIVDRVDDLDDRQAPLRVQRPARSEEHTSELQSLMRSSYAILCLKKQQQTYDN